MPSPQSIDAAKPAAVACRSPSAKVPRGWPASGTSSVAVTERPEAPESGASEASAVVPAPARLPAESTSETATTNDPARE